MLAIDSVLKMCCFFASMLVDCVFRLGVIFSSRRVECLLGLFVGLLRIRLAFCSSMRVGLGCRRGWVRFLGIIFSAMMGRLMFGMGIIDLLVLLCFAAFVASRDLVLSFLLFGCLYLFYCNINR